MFFHPSVIARFRRGRLAGGFVGAPFFRRHAVMPDPRDDLRVEALWFPVPPPVICTRLGLPCSAASAGSCGFAFCAFCLLALLLRRAFGEPAVLFFFAEALLFLLLTLLGLTLRDPRRLSLRAPRPSSAGFLRSLALGAFGQLTFFFLFAEASFLFLLTLLGFAVRNALRLLVRAALPSPTSSLGGFPLGAFSQPALLLLLAEAPLFLLLALLGLALL
jgi:hypothetical protein